VVGKFDLKSREFQKRLVLGFSITIVLSCLLAGVSFSLLHSVAASKDLVIYDSAQDLIVAERLQAAIQKKIAVYRAFLIYRADIYGDELPRLQEQIHATLNQLEGLTNSVEAKALLGRIEAGNQLHDELYRRTQPKIKSGVTIKQLIPFLESQGRPIRRGLERDVFVLRLNEGARPQESENRIRSRPPHAARIY